MEMYINVRDWPQSPKYSTAIPVFSFSKVVRFLLCILVLLKVTTFHFVKNIWSIMSLIKAIYENIYVYRDVIQCKISGNFSDNSVTLVNLNTELKIKLK